MTICWLIWASPTRADEIKFCFLFCGIERATVADSFCQAYERVIRAPADAAEIGKVARTVAKRVARNDALYRCACQNWDNPICKDLKK